MCPLWCHKVARSQFVYGLTLWDALTTLLLSPPIRCMGVSFCFKLWPSVFADDFKQRANFYQYHKGRIMLFSGESWVLFQPLNKSNFVSVPQKIPRLQAPLWLLWAFCFSFFCLPFRMGRGVGLEGRAIRRREAEDGHGPHVLPQVRA